MIRRSIPFGALILSACVSQAAYDEQAAQLEKARAEVATQQAKIAEMQSRNRWVMAGDLLFPQGGYELSPAGEAALSHYLPQLRSLKGTKVVVYGFTDNTPVGPELRQAGIADNLDLSSRRAANVVAFFRANGVDPDILSAKGFGATHPIAPNDTPVGREQNRRIEIILEGRGA